MRVLARSGTRYTPALFSLMLLEPFRRSATSILLFPLGIAVAHLMASASPPVGGPYVIFYGSNETEPDERAGPILDHAAGSLLRLKAVRVIITAHSDSAGSSELNVEVSRKRASAVRAYLIRQGLPADAIITHALGETRLLVETADGVAEPQNRRVEISAEFAPMERVL